MKVVSLFDGIACGLEALKRAGFNITEYNAYEIEAAPMLVSNWNHPEIIQHGSVVGADFKKHGHVDILLGGSPCQGFSFAGAQLNFEDPRSMLFFEYWRAYTELKKINPNIKFLLENVVMKKEHIHVISDFMGVEPIMINSALVSAQTRKRLYWTNIKGIEQPEDRHIYLRDILIDGGEYGAAIRGRRYDANGKRSEDAPLAQCLEFNPTGKSNSITTVAKDSVVWLSDAALAYMAKPDHGNPNKSRAQVRSNRPNEKAKALTASTSTVPHRVVELINPERSKTIANNPRSRIYNKDSQKTGCLLANQAKQSSDAIVINLGDYRYRYLTPIECERLQGLSDAYTDMISKTQRLKALGNGWQVDTIVHIFNYLQLELIL